MKINKIGFLCSSKAIKPQIILQNLLNNHFLDDKIIFLITNDSEGSVYDFFKKENIHLLESIEFNSEDMKNIGSFELDLLISLGWSYLIPKHVVDKFEGRLINCHGSYLPDYRGMRSYMHYWANNENYFGASIHYVTEKFDDGNILVRSRIRMLKDETKESVHYRSCELSALQIPIAIEKIENNEIGMNVVDEKARYYKKESFDKLVAIGINNRKLYSNYAEDLKKYKHTKYKVLSNNAPRVMIVGAGILQYYLIEKVNELGYISIAVDANPNAIGFTIADFYQTIDIKDKELCLDYARQMKINAVITGATDYGVITSSYIAQKLGLNGLNYSISRIVKNKYEVQKILYKKCITLKKSYRLSSLNEFEIIKNKIQYPVIVKPVDGSGSRGVNKAYSSKKINEFIHEALTNSILSKCMIEPFITGNEYGGEFFVYKGNIYNLIVMSKKMTDYPYFAELGHTSSMNDELNKRIIKKAHEIIKALEIDYGSVNMDFIVNDEEVYMVDIGCRMGGNLIGSHIIPMSTGIDYMKIIIEAALNHDIKIENKYNYAICSRLITLPSGIVRYIDRNIINELNCLYKIILCKVGDKVNSYKNNLDGCGYVICKGDNENEAEIQATNTLKKIQEAILVKKEDISDVH